MTVCFKIAVVGGFLISAMNFGTDVASLLNWETTYEEYNSHADKITEAIDGEATSNFKADSEWFTAISTEYEAASDFDKEYVYCDVVTLQSQPAEFYDVGTSIWMAGCIFTWMSGFSFVLGWIYLFWLLRKMCVEQKCAKHCAAAHGHCKEDDDDKDLPRHKMVGRQKQKREFMRWSAIRLLMAAGPMVAMNYIIVLRRSATNGFECHEKFYDCGVAGSCDIGDLMVPVALNSSYLDLITSNTLMMLAIFSGVADVAFSVLASLALFIRAADFGYIWLPVLTLAGASITMVWMVFIDEKVDGLASSMCVLLIAHIPILILLVYGIVCMCIEDRHDRKHMYVAEKMTADQKAQMEAYNRRRLKRNCFHVFCCVWCGPCCKPGALRQGNKNRPTQTA